MYFFTSAYWICCILVIKVIVGSVIDDDAMVSYDGAQVWRIVLRNRADNSLVEQLADNQDISIWNFNHKVAEFMVMPERLERMARVLTIVKMNHSVIIPNVQRDIDGTKPVEPMKWDRPSIRIGHRMNWKSYPTPKIIDEYYNYLTNSFPKYCKIRTIGRSFQNRPIKMVSISNGNPNNKVILITAGQHSREWVGITSAFYLINHIVTNFKTLEPTLKYKDWHIVPLVNPDGFEYTQSKDRLWRKNRRQQKKCFGVDLNRNYDISWNGDNVDTKDECQPIYPGKGPFSEPETMSISKAFKGFLNKPTAFFDFHAYGKLVIHPWSVDTTKPHINEKNLRDTAIGITKAIYNATNQKYKCGTARELLYSASGAAIDWFYSMGVPLSFAIEGRDSGNHGFLLPKDQIENASKDMLAAVRYVTEVLDGKNGKSYWLRHLDGL